MGWKTKLLALLLGLTFIGGGLWPIGILCFIYILIPGRSTKERTAETHPRRRGFISWRYLLGFALIVLAGVAVATGGTLSPIVFSTMGVVVLAWPQLGLRLPIGEVEPVKDSVLLRSRYFPFAWHAVAELKAGAEPFPRAASSFEGRLTIFTETGKTYLVASCVATGRREAESKVLSTLRSASSHRNAGAFLLPLESGAASVVFRLNFSPSRVSSRSLIDTATTVSGILLLDCNRGVVRRAGAYEIGGPATSAKIPSRTADLETAPLVWEVLESLGKRTGWPDPDALSNLLDSFSATKGVSLGERLKRLEGEGEQLRVQSLAGEELRISRPQMRAIVSIYS